MLGQRSEIVGAVSHKILGHRAAVELRDKARRNFRAAPGQRFAGLLDQGAGGVFFLIAGTLSGHGTSGA
jgi:hypothetical protein